MPFARPSLTALRNQAVQDITTSGVPGLDGLLRNAGAAGARLGYVGAGYSVYGYLDWIARESACSLRPTNTYSPGGIDRRLSEGQHARERHRAVYRRDRPRAPSALRYAPGRHPLCNYR